MPKFNLPDLTFELRLFVAIVFVAGAFAFNAEGQIIRKKMVEFYAEDSLLVSADHYYSDPENPYILLLHQEHSSRGEFSDIAERFVKMKYNCLAVDLRIGDSYEYVNNLTARRARQKAFISNQDIEKDIRAAIRYIKTRNSKSIILLGSSLSASMALKVGRESEKVKAIMAFSPGEFFLSGFQLKTALNEAQKPIYIACAPDEYTYLADSILTEKQEHVNLVKPPGNTSSRGAQMLLTNNPSHDQIWFSVLIFIKSLQD